MLLNSQDLCVDLCPEAEAIIGAYPKSPGQLARLHSRFGPTPIVIRNPDCQETSSRGSCRPRLPWAIRESPLGNALLPPVVLQRKGFEKVGRLGGLLRSLCCQILKPPRRPPRRNVT